MKSDPDKVIPILERIAFGSESPKQAGRALFMLAESGRPEARDTVLRVAKEGPEPVRVVAVKTLGRFQGPEISGELLQVYATANELVKLQVVRSLGERAEKGALLRIAQSEKDGRVRYIAFECLGQAGEVEHLAKMYKSASRPGKRSIIVGLFIARADGSLIQIADAESRAGDQELRANVLERLRVLGTPRAKEYLQKVSEKR
jgi:HEAT repeat protein